MLYDLNKQIERERFNRRVGSLLEKEDVIVELTEKKDITRNQKSYLHCILGYFALETGNTIEYVKKQYFKILCNSDIFVTEKQDAILGRSVKDLRSVSSLDTSETTIAISKFRNWSSETCGIYLPEPNEDRFLREISIEIDKNRQYL